MIKIGITGSGGFVGSHLYNTLNLDKEHFEIVAFETHFFSNSKLLEHWVCQCDTIVHLAALNRHKNPDIIYDTNIYLVKQLITALQNTNAHPHILFSSSTQEEKDNIYGKSKKEGRLLLESWAKKNKAKFTGLVIPNVYGPFGLPFYNSVVATFCYQLTHKEKPEIDIDGELKLIYVGELIEVIIQQIQMLAGIENKDAVIETIAINYTTKIKVSDLLNKIETFKNNYFDNGFIPGLTNKFDINLFNTFVCYIDHKSFYPYYLLKNTDDRGSFVETVKLLNSGGQISYSTTVSGITRGNHFHTRKAERFAVIKGKALIELREIGTEKVMSFELDGEKPSFVDMPIWHTHNIKNIGSEELYTIFWINELYNASDPDTYFEKV